MNRTLMAEPPIFSKLFQKESYINRRHSNFFHYTLFTCKLNWNSTNFIVNNHIENFCYHLLNRNKRLRGLWNMNMKIWLGVFLISCYSVDTIIVYLHPNAISVYFNIDSGLLYSLSLKWTYCHYQKYHLLFSRNQSNR